MELDEMQQIWQRTEAKLTGRIQHMERLVQGTLRDNTAISLRRLGHWLIPEFVLNGFAVLLLGSFCLQHFDDWRYLFPGLSLLLGSLSLIGASIFQLNTIAKLDYSGPIVGIQRRLESIRRVRLQTVKWVFLLAPLVWAFFFIVAIRSLTGIDVYRAFPTNWLLGNILFGVVVVALGYWVSRRFSDRFSRYQWVQGLMQSIAGTHLNQANQFLATLAEFEAEQDINHE